MKIRSHKNKRRPHTRDHDPAKNGITLLLVVVLLAAIFSISIGVFTLIFGQIRITAEMEDSFKALYAADQGVERVLRLDRVPVPPLGAAFNETKNDLPSGACYKTALTKTGGAFLGGDTFINVVGEFPRCGSTSLRIVKRAFLLGYPSIGPPVGYWKFNDGPPSQTATDSSGSGNPGTLGDTPAAEATDPAWIAQGAANFALSFDGGSTGDDFLNAGSQAAIDDLSSVSISAWIYPKSFGGGGLGRIMQKGLSGIPPAGGFFVFLDGTGSPTGLTFRAVYNGTDLTRQTDSTTIVMNTWQHVMVTWNGGQKMTDARMYKNGAEVTYFSPFSPIDATGSKEVDAPYDLLIGNSEGKNRAFDGCIEELKLWNRALSTEEVRMDYITTPPPAGGC